MESTGVYWIPAYEILEAHGFEVILVNARYAKNVPRRKTFIFRAIRCSLREGPVFHFKSERDVKVGVV